MTRGRNHTCRDAQAISALGRLVNGVRVDPVTRKSFIGAINDFRKCGESHVIQFLAADPTVIAMDDIDYKEVLNRANLNVADGLPVAVGLRIQGVATDRIPGTEALRLVAAWGRGAELRHYFYGGDERLGPELKLHLDADFPGITIAGWEAPPFRPLSPSDYGAAAERIRAEGTDLLWIGLGTPKQHLAAVQLAALRAAPVILCVGAAFDFVAGTKRRAPVWMQKAGLEWLYRLGSEPHRLWRRYLIGNPRFVGGVSREWMSSRRRRT